MLALLDNEGRGYNETVRITNSSIDTYNTASLSSSSKPDSVNSSIDTYNTASSSTSISKPDSTSSGPRVHIYVVVRLRRSSCWACRIYTLGEKATTERDDQEMEYGMVYCLGQQPQLSFPRKERVRIRMTDGVPALQIPSRIHYGVHLPIEFDVKAKEIGQVPVEDIPILIANWMEDAGRFESQR